LCSSKKLLSVGERSFFDEQIGLTLRNHSFRNFGLHKDGKVRAVKLTRHTFGTFIDFLHGSQLAFNFHGGGNHMKDIMGTNLHADLASCTHGGFYINIG
jgi:hypothetical protein